MKLRCPKCKSTNINQYRMPTGAIWCVDCGYKEEHKEIENTFIIDNKEKRMTTKKTVKQIVENKEYCPIPLEVIPNQMGINLCSIDSVEWTKQEDGQLVDLRINFIPAN